MTTHFTKYAPLLPSSYHSDSYTLSYYIDAKKKERLVCSVASLFRTGQLEHSRQGHKLINPRGRVRQHLAKLGQAEALTHTEGVSVDDTGGGGRVGSGKVGLG